MKKPTGGEVLFSLKCFVAALLALYLALLIELPRPFWSMMTTYIVASPLSGSVRSKAVYRVCGTLFGSAVTVFFVPQLANSPELLSLALAGWVGLCLSVSLLDRTPRSYVFMLAGYTAALIGFPVVADPGSVFDVAVARVEEITLGIVCATLVHSLVFPQSLGPVLLSRVDRALADAQRWIGDVVTNRASDHGARARRTLAGDVTELRLMSTHLPFDTSHLRWTSDALHALQDRLALMVPVLSAVEDRLAVLRRIDAASLTSCWHAVLDDIGQWVQSPGPDNSAHAARLHQELNKLSPVVGSGAGWSQILQLNLAARLHALVDICQESLELRQHIDAVLHGAPPVGTGHQSSLTHQVLHRDYGMALRSGLAATFAIGACCVFWIMTSWSSGGVAAMMCAVFCCFFATQDDPVPSIRLFTYYTMLSTLVSSVYLLGILPSVHSFEMLALVFAPFFLVAGIYAGRPATGLQAMALLTGVFGMLTLQDSGTAEFAVFINSTLAQLVGMMSAALFTGLLRSVSAGWTARRLLHKGWVELARLAEMSETGSRAASADMDHSVEHTASVMAVSANMLDRIALLTPRLAMNDPQHDQSAINALGDLRIGLTIARLRTLQTRLAQAGIDLYPLMQHLALYFRGRSAVARFGSVPGVAQDAIHTMPVLLTDIDGLLRAVCASAAGAQLHQAIVLLASLRQDLFPDAVSYDPLITSSGVSAVIPSAHTLAEES